MNPLSPLAFDNSYARLPERFYDRQLPTAVSAPGLIRVNSGLADAMGVDPGWLASPEGIASIAGNRIPPGAEPIATAYAGHQFGHWNPQLGDGRAILLGELVARDGRRYDLQLKGSGRTRYSRGGDGRAPIGPVLREYIVSESMAVFGVPTTRALAAVTTGERVMRKRVEPGAILARVASSHIRIGTCQFFASRNDIEGLRALIDHVIWRHYPAAAEAAIPALAMLQNVVNRQASLIAMWQHLGFIHGVMNTDNMLLSGETIDYGPCAFIDDYHPDMVFSSIDHGGRYAFSNQPGIAYWNLGALAQALLPILSDDPEQAVAMAEHAVAAFVPQYQQAYRAGMARKIGLGEYRDEDESLIDDLLSTMASQGTDFTLAFRRLTELASPQRTDDDVISHFFELGPAFEPWLQRWRQRLSDDAMPPARRRDLMSAHNPVFIPRNHLIEEVIEAALEDGNLEPFHQLVDVLADPYEYRGEKRHYALPPREEQRVRQTFCGT
jgi:uncharacterized protein YdiU (UPF0061 family)